MLTATQIEKQIDGKVSNEDRVKAIDSWIHNERDRLMLKLRLVDGYTFKQISVYLEKHQSDYIIPLDEERVKQKVPELERKLFKHLG
jgi:hypothetical protein